MARKALPGAESAQNVDETIIDVPFEDISDMERDGDEQIAAILGEFGGASHEKDITLKVYRVMEGKGRMGWLFDCLPVELPIMTRLRDEYGSGDYAIRVLVNNVLKKILRFAIIAPVKRENAPQNDLTAVLRAMSENQTRMFEQLQTVMSGTREGNATTRMSETLELMRTFKEVFQPAAPQNSLKETIETLAAMKELLPESGGGGGGSNLWDFAKTLLTSPVVGQLAEAVAVAKNNAVLLGQPQRAPMLPPQTVTAAPPHHPIPTPDPVEVQNVSFRDQVILNQVKMLTEKAKAGKDAGLYADLILDNIPADVIVQEMLQPNSLQRLFQMHPEAANYQPWFEELQKMLAEGVAEILPPEFPQDHADPNAPTHTADPGPVHIPDNVPSGNA